MADNTVRFKAVMDDKVSSQLDKIRGKFDTLGKSKGFKSFTQGIGVGVGVSAFNLAGAALSGLADEAFKSINAASDLNEQVSKSRVVFGDASKAVEDFAAKADLGLGLSKRAALEAAGTFGNFFTNLGKTQTEAAAMSTRLVTLAGDLASFNNLDPTETLDKLRSGLSGEAEPLRTVGVFLTEAKVKAKALELGLAGAHGELSEGAKVFARYQLILDETTTAQGDFARTSEGFANTQRVLNAELENLRAEIGEQLLPVMVDLAHVMRDDVVPAIHDTVQAAKDAGPVVDEFFKILHLAASGGQTDLGRLRADAEKQFKAMGEASKGSAEEMASAAARAGGATQKLDGALGTTRTESDKLGRSIAKTARISDESLDSILDAVYGPAILRGREAGILQDIKANEKALRAAKRAGDSLEVARLQGELASLRSDLDRTRKKEEEVGARPVSRGMQNWLAARIAQVGVLHGKYISAAAAAAILAGSPAGNQNPGVGHAYAMGGHANAGEWSIVGERGPELRFEASPANYVNARDTARMMGGETIIHTHINLDGRQIALVVDKHQGYMLDRASPYSGR